VFDTVGGDVAQRSFAVLKPGGRAAFIASGAEAPKPDRTDVTSLRPAVGRARAPLERIAQLVAAGAIRPPEIKLYRLSQAAEAHRVSESRHFRGKLAFSGAVTRLRLQCSGTSDRGTCRTSSPWGPGQCVCHA
jgi:NADPH:quinone reductase-like Zn-dependent oxidoreductase